MKTVVVYHSIDLDGQMSAAIVKHWFVLERNDGKPYTFDSKTLGDTDKGVEVLDFIGYNYGQPIPDLSDYDKVIMCDISFPREFMIEMLEKWSMNITYIDHHISAMEELSGVQIKSYCDVKFAACELTWKYFFPNETMPEIIRLLGMYDSFRHKGTEEEQKVLEFQYGARQAISSYEEAYKCLYYNISESAGIHLNYSLVNIQRSGKYIYQYLCTEAKQVYKNGFVVVFDEEHWFDSETFLGKMTDGYRERKFICINKERFNPINFGIDYHKDGYDGAACFHYDGIAKLYRFSLYNDNGLIDCSVIAKQFGGGGHKGAAGFVVDDLTVILK
jgi:hypothetical protein